MQLQTVRKGRIDKWQSPMAGFISTTALINICNSTAWVRKNAFLRLTLYMWGCLHLLCLAVGSCYAIEPNQASQPSQAWNISADRIDYDKIQDLYTATGNVTIDREGRKLTADNVRINQKTREAFAQGNVRLESGGDVLSGDHLKINMDYETGTLTDGTLFFSKNHLYLSGRKIHKTGLQTYSAQNVRITSCDDPDPDWEITGQDFKVTVEGYGFAKHAALWAGKIPVFYSPFLAFPAKLNRQTGFLMPEPGISNRKGNQYLQPFFWAINDHTDATLYAHYMSERGLRAGLEYRYVLNENTLGTLIAEGFEDERIDDGQGDASERWGYDDEDNDQLRLNDDRYWIRMKHDQRLASGENLKLDIDVVSDQDYLHEFKSGYNGFDKTQAYFQETFGRDIDDYNDPVRLNRLNFNRIWTSYSLNTDIRWYDDVIKRRIEETDDTVQRLPEISFNGIKHPLGNSPFYFDLASSYSHLYRINGTRGHRSDLYPRIYYPTMIWDVFSVEPSAGFRQTAWQVDHYESYPDHGRRTHYRGIYDAKLDVSTEIFRLFDINIAGVDRLKHAITPEVVYEYTPDDDQTDFPQFDELDRIERKNLITYGFTNTLTARTPVVSGNDPAQYTYNPFLRIELSQSFDINKSQEDDPTRPYSDIAVELDLAPGRYIALDTDTLWSPYDNQLNAFNSILSLWDSRGDQLSVDYRYTREAEANTDTGTLAQAGIESIGVTVGAVLSNQWRLRAGYEYDLQDNEELEARAGIGYSSQCWGVDIDYLSEQDNYGAMILFHLKGLGPIGGSVF
jgi:LPS-assembly protein